MHLIKDGILAYLYDHIYEGIRSEGNSDIVSTNEAYRKMEDCAEAIVQIWEREHGKTNKDTL